MRFQEIVSTEEELRSLVGHPSELVQNKVISHLDEHCRNFISKSPLVILSTADENGYCDVSPRGDASGFVSVLDETHLLIPERPGNRRLDTLRNVLSNPRIGLVFIIPGLEETLRINGQASIIRDEELLKGMESHGRIPVLALAVKVEECFIHCAKAFLRSQLWQSHTWLDAEERPKAAKILADHAKMDNKSVEDLLQESYTNRLY